MALGFELRSEDVSQADRSSACGHDRDGLRRSQRPGQPPREPPQGLGDRANGAKIGAGSDHEFDVVCMQGGERSGQVPHRFRGPHSMGHVVGADHDHGQLRVLGQYPFDLFDQSRRFRTYDRSVDQLDRAARQCRQADRDPGRWRVGVGMDAITGG